MFKHNDFLYVNVHSILILGFLLQIFVTRIPDYMYINCVCDVCEILYNIILFFLLKQLSLIASSCSFSLL